MGDYRGITESPSDVHTLDTLRDLKASGIRATARGKLQRLKLSSDSYWGLDFPLHLVNASGTTSMYGDRRRRFAKACDPCRRKKLRCDGVRPLCARCRDSNTPCHYADVQKPATRRSRARDSTSTPRRLDGEHGTRSVIGSESPSVQWSTPAGIEAPREDGTSSRRHTNLAPSTPATENAGPRGVGSGHRVGSSVRANDPARDPDTIVGRNVDTRFFGPASGISLVSIREGPQGSDPPKGDTTQHRFQEGSWSSWTHPSIQGMLEKRVSRPLPLWSEAFSLVSDFFSHEHQTFPCFHPPTFMTLLGQQYSGNPSDSPAWWASINAVLAISQRRRVENGQCDTNGEKLAWDYAANALGVTLDIMMRNTQLISVQALLCIARFFLGTPNPQPSFMLVGSAVRLAHSIGLHKIDHGACLSSIEQETRNKVFWIALTLDRELCLQTGRPPTHDLEHFRVQLPADCLHDDSEIITIMNGSKLRLTKSHAELCLIQDLLIHRPLARTFWLSLRPEDASHLTESIKDSIQQCLTAARCIVDLFQAIPHKQKSFYWDVVPPILSATVILATNAIRTKISHATRGDLEKISTVIELFEILDEDESDTYLFQVRRLCRDLYQSVQLAFKSSEGQPSSQARQKDWAHQSGGDENGQSDFSQMTQSSQGRIIPSSDPLPLPEIDAASSAVGIEPGSERNLFAANGWPSGMLSFPDMAPWGMDMLSGGLFAPYP
ncbi:hypothetical protein G7054_g12112 [Neopestalotiopsis clavispora]|nr:hypothetical protein G7054_g12112 [Neopestalotiopsis clavispora]